jgi:hypothetical protein
MADVNFGILDTQAPGRIAAIPQQAQAQQTQNMLTALQAQQTVRQGEVSQMQLQKMKSDEAALNNFYDYVAKAGGPTDPIELEQKLIGSRVPHLVDLGIKAQSTRLENDKYQAYKKSLAPPVAAAAVPSAFSENMSQNVMQANAALPSWAPTNKLAPQPSVNTMAAEPTLRDLQAQYSELARFNSPQAKAEMDVIKLRIADKLKTQVVGPGASVVRDGVVSYTAPVAGSPLARLESERAAFPPGDPRIPTWTAAINEISIAPGAHRKVTEDQGAERNRIAQARLNIEQNKTKLGLADADVPLIMAAVTSGKLNPDKLTPTTAPMYADLLRVDPNADFVGAGNTAAAARTGAVTGARIGAEQTRNTSLTPEMIQQHGNAYNTNGKLPSLGSGPQAAVDRVAILRYASENNPTDATTKELNKAKLAALVPLAKQEAAVTNYVKTFDKNIELARDALTKVSNTNVPALNAWLLNPAQRQLTGDPDLKALGVYVSSLQAEFAKIQSGAMGNSVTADAAIKRAQDNINTADSPRAFRAALDAMVKESRNRLDSFEDTRKEMAAKVRGQPAPTTPAAATPNAATPSAGWGKAEAK